MKVTVLSKASLLPVERVHAPGHRRSQRTSAVHERRLCIEYRPPTRSRTMLRAIAISQDNLPRSTCHPQPSETQVKEMRRKLLMRTCLAYARRTLPGPASQSIATPVRSEGRRSCTWTSGARNLTQQMGNKPAHGHTPLQNRVLPNWRLARCRWRPRKHGESSLRGDKSDDSDPRSPGGTCQLDARNLPKRLCGYARSEYGSSNLWAKRMEMTSQIRSILLKMGSGDQPFRADSLL